MKYISYFLLAIFTSIKVSLDNLFSIVQKWYLPFKKEDEIIYYAFAPFYYLLVGLNLIFKWSCDKLAKGIK